MLRDAIYIYSVLLTEEIKYEIEFMNLQSSLCDVY